MSIYFTTEAFNLKVIPFAEADKLITLFSFGLGKIKGLAKGSRKISSKLGGRLEPFVLNRLMLVKGKTFYHIISAETKDFFWKIRKNINKLNLAFYFLWLIDKITLEGQINKDLFILLLKYFYYLEESSNLNTLKLNFEKDLLKTEGILDRRIKNVREHLEDYAGVALPVI